MCAAGAGVGAGAALAVTACASRAVGGGGRIGRAFCLSGPGTFGLSQCPGVGGLFGPSTSSMLARTGCAGSAAPPSFDMMVSKCRVRCALTKRNAN